MPLLDGEGGENAFIGLQEEIIKASTDQTIFGWGFRMPITLHLSSSQSLLRKALQMRSLPVLSPFSLSYHPTERDLLLAATESNRQEPDAGSRQTTYSRYLRKEFHPPHPEVQAESEWYATHVRYNVLDGRQPMLFT
ncbi:hypothetical protein QBC47DRAFT_463668 [Echria macrotheca]|uniref:Uncharacterized protein n=1 Tax=Echria macrotheca TaxID=438768 RepID=A0AAJ0B8Y9_9PEZI|nr:hypothetical protein QBC47DRAFT_463668 [Echria macrotheca]